MKRYLAGLATGLLLLVTVGKAAELTPAQTRVFKHRLHKSETVVAWWNHRGRWALHSRYKACWQIRPTLQRNGHKVEASGAWRQRRICRLARASLTAHAARRDRLERLLTPPRPIAYDLSYWVGRQIWAATIIGRESGGDPWPNCPDPFDGGGSWNATVACENGGNWYDSPGYFRCGLQFEPAWERRFGRLCP